MKSGWRKGLDELSGRNTQQTITENGREARGDKNRKAVETGRSRKVKATFMGVAMRLWNKAQESATKVKT